jgi:Tfp pilus assembly protein PilN
MKIPINLASQPFRRDRALLVASVAVSILLIGTLGVLVSLAMADRRQLADVRADVARLNNSIRTLTTQQIQLDAVLRKPENALVLQRSVFLNSMLLRKGISWTRIFADLEKVLPYNVRIIQIHPIMDAHNELSLDMQVGSESPVPVIEMMKNMGSQPFSNPDVKLQQAPTQAEPLWRYRLSVGYAQKI